MEHLDRSQLFGDLEYMFQAILKVSDSQYQTALHELIRAVDSDVTSGRDIDGRRLLMCLQALLVAVDSTLADDVPGWRELDLTTDE